MNTYLYVASLTVVAQSHKLLLSFNEVLRLQRRLNESKEKKNRGETLDRRQRSDVFLFDKIHIVFLLITKSFRKNEDGRSTCTYAYTHIHEIQ